MSEQGKPTPGEAREHGMTVVVGGEVVCWMGEPAQHAWDTSRMCVNAIANRTLIVDAFNVYHETGLSPRQLAEQRRRLSVTLRAIIEWWERQGNRSQLDGLISHACAVVSETTGPQQ